MWNSLFGATPGKTAPEGGNDETIHVFSLASGHLYERFLKIMMQSVISSTKSPVKFWFLENFASPQFKTFVPMMAKELGYEVLERCIFVLRASTTVYVLFLQRSSLSRISGQNGLGGKRRNSASSGAIKFYFLTSSFPWTSSASFILMPTRYFLSKPTKVSTSKNQLQTFGSLSRLWEEISKSCGTWTWVKLLTAILPFATATSTTICCYWFFC